MNWDQSDVTVTGKETLKSLLSSCNDVRMSRLDGQFSHRGLVSFIYNMDYLKY